jgi:hypothetical protein
MSGRVARSHALDLPEAGQHKPQEKFMGGFLSAKELAELVPSELCPHQTPIPTQIVSSDEYYPDPQNEKQREVENRLLAMADDLGKRQGLDRRRFFQTAAGMAASFVAMNEVYGPLFDVTRAEAATPAMAQERANALKDQFIMDMHTHFLRDDTRIMNFVAMRAAVGKAGWNKQLADKEQTIEDLKFGNYIKEMFLDSDTKIAMISSAPSDIEQDWFLTNQQMAEAREKVNREGRLPPAVCALNLHPGAAGLARQARRGPRAEAGILQGVHNRRQYAQGNQPLSVAHGRREGRLQGLREDGEGGHQECLRSQGPVPTVG